ncbi:MAG: AarF/ABC1/UbiB kinase family protein [Coriobacteriales bacterium]|nr:AarF/ABC1/UbiB kinase family protein [Coriobacteriales bacterium]
MSRSRHIAATLARAGWRGTTDARLGLVGASASRAAFARRTREAFEELGPAFIKLGQLLSVRPDVVPPEWVFEMESLRDSVPSAPPEAIRAVIAEDFGATVEELFESWDDAPIASASIAQVHRAILRRRYRPVVGEELAAGAELAVKVVRPGVERGIAADIEVARSSVTRLPRLPGMARIDMPALLAEFTSTLRSECDMRNEAAVADRFAFDFRDDELIVVPRVVWPLTSRRVLTMEFIEGWPLSEISDAQRAGVDGYALALHGATTFMRQVLVAGRFHADLHPANLLVTPEGRIAYLDFGIIGTTTPAQRDAIAQILVATVYGDADRALTYSAELGLVVGPDRRGRVRERVAALMRDTLAVEPRDIRGFAIGFLGIMADEKVDIPVGYGLLIKALVTVEGVARALYPEIDITVAAKPFVTEFVAARMLSPQRMYEKLPAAMNAALRELTR